MIRPMGNTIIGKMPEKQERTRGGLWIPQTWDEFVNEGEHEDRVAHAEQEPPHEAILLAIGPKARPYLEAHGIGLGSRVKIKKFGGEEINLVKEDVDWGEVLILKPDDIEAGLEN